MQLGEEVGKGRQRVRSCARVLPRGLTLVDVLVALFLAAVVLLLLLMAVPRNREQARLTTCQRNLSQIGLALALYDQTFGELPRIGALEEPLSPAADCAPGPLRILLEALGQADFRGLGPAGTSAKPSGPAHGEIPVPGFVCASDPSATAGLFRAPVSYRACTGSTLSGSDGVFAPGQTTSIALVEERDGAGFTAAFAERLVGDGMDDHLSAANYAVVPGPLPEKGISLVWLKDQVATWRGDAGATWYTAGYRGTLYNHALLPGAPLSCLTRDGRSAALGASSGHTRGLNLLLLDGSVKLISPSIDDRVWKRFATVAEPAPGPPVP